MVPLHSPKNFINFGPQTAKIGPALCNFFILLC